MSSTPTGGPAYTEQNLNTFLNRVLSTADTTVFRHLDLDLHHNARYEQSRLLDLLAHCGVSGEFANGGARTRRVTTGDRLRIRSDRRSPDAKALGRHLRHLDRDGIDDQFDDAFDAFHGLARRARLFERPVDVAVDVHDWLFYGDDETDMVATTNPSQGTSTAYKFVTACVITDGLRLTVAVEPLAASAKLPEALSVVIDTAQERVDIRRIYLDRGFYRVACLQALHDADVAYVMRAPRFQSLDGAEPQIQVEDDYRITQSNAPYEWVRATRFTVPNAQSPEEKQTYFVTNCAVSQDTAVDLAESYRRRWGIETSYRVIGDFLAKSRSTVYSVRLFYFLFAVLLYNLWVLCNRLLSTVFGWDLDLPAISAAVFGRLIGQHWRGELVDPG